MEHVTLRDTQELFSNSYQQPRGKTLLNHMFYYIPTKDLENYCSQIPEKTSQRVSGTRKNHIFTKLLADQLHRQFSCLCDYVLNFTLIRVYFMESLSFSTCSHFTLLHMILVVMVFQKMLVISPNMNIMKPRCQL